MVPVYLKFLRLLMPNRIAAEHQFFEPVKMYEKNSDKVK